MNTYSVVVHDKHGRTLTSMQGTSNLMFATLVKEEIIPWILKWSDKDDKALNWDSVSIVVSRGGT